MATGGVRIYTVTAGPSGQYCTTVQGGNYTI